MTNTIGATPEERELIEDLREPDSHDPTCPFSQHCYCDDGAPHDNVLDEVKLRAADALESLISDRAKLREALEPFAAMGKVMEIRSKVTFGRSVPDTEIVCESSGEAGLGVLTMGHFRDAVAMLPDAPSWGGQYRSLRALDTTQDTGNG